MHTRFLHRTNMINQNIKKKLYNYILYLYIENL